MSQSRDTQFAIKAQQAAKEAREALLREGRGHETSDIEAASARQRNALSNPVQTP